MSLTKDRQTIEVLNAIGIFCIPASLLLLITGNFTETLGVCGIGLIAVLLSLQK
jgi:hypothetical protein